MFVKCWTVGLLPVVFSGETIHLLARNYSETERYFEARVVLSYQAVTYARLCIITHINNIAV